MSNAQAATIHGGRAESATLASWFAQFDYSRVVVDVVDSVGIVTGAVDMMHVISTVTSNAARIYIDYGHNVVTAEIVDRYTNAPKTGAAAMHNTVMLEQFLRKHKVIVAQQLRKLEDASDEHLLIAAKSVADMRSGSVAAHWNTDEKMSPADRTALILQLREMGFHSLDITNRSRIIPCTKKYDDVVITEAEWLNNVRKPRVRKYA
jgi:hypothetical protein